MLYLCKVVDRLSTMQPSIIADEIKRDIMKRALTLLILAALSAANFATSAQLFSYRGTVVKERRFWNDGTAKSFTPPALHGDIEEIKVTTKRSDGGVSTHYSTFKFNEHGDVVSWVSNNATDKSTFELYASYDQQNRLLKEESYDNGSLRERITYEYSDDEITVITFRDSNDTSVERYRIETFESENGNYKARHYAQDNGNYIKQIKHTTTYGDIKIVRERLNHYLYPVTRSYIFDHNGLLLEQNTFEGRSLFTHNYEYDDKGRLIADRMYDDCAVYKYAIYTYTGNSVVKLTYNCNDDLDEHVETKLDDRGNVIEYKEMCVGGDTEIYEHVTFEIKYRK